MKEFYNLNLDRIQQSGTVALADKVRQLEAGGRKIIPLHTGDPDFATPAPIIDAAHKAMKDGLTHYSNSRGLPALREEVSKYFSGRYSALYKAGTEILITNGGIHAYFLAITSIIKPGDEVLVQDPTWMSHVNIVKLAGGTPVTVVSNTPGSFIPSADDYRKKITSKTRAIIINSPGNPTGEIAGKEHLQSILNLAQQHNLYVISDEVYDNLVFDNKKFTSASSFAEHKERVIIVNSFSKTFAMTGWRVGYLAAHENVIENALKVSQCTITNEAPFIQQAALEGMRSKEVWNIVEVMRKKYEWRANEVMKLFNDSGNTKLKIKKPAGAFYFFIDVKQLGWGNAEQTAMRLLDECSVAVVPGTVFGAQGEGYIRMTFAASDEHVLEGFKRILQAN